MECAPKNSEGVVILRQIPCDDTPTAAPVAQTTCGISLLIGKNVLFSYSTYRYSYGAGSGSIVTRAVAQCQNVS